MYSYGEKNPLTKRRKTKVIWIFLVCSVSLWAVATKGRQSTGGISHAAVCSNHGSNQGGQVKGLSQNTPEKIDYKFLEDWFQKTVGLKRWGVLASVLTKFTGREGPTEKGVSPQVEVTAETLGEVRHRIRWGETAWSLARRYGVSLRQLEENNPGLNLRHIKSGDWLMISRGQSVSRDSRPRSDFPRSPSTSSTLKERSLIPPVVGRLTSPYGRRSTGMHWGIDLAAPAGAPVRAVAVGEVRFAGWSAGYGRLIILEHRGFKTYYAHNSRLCVAKGEKVQTGQIIAEVGQTGRATGNHLHFEVEIKGSKINPFPYLVQ